MTIRVGLMLFPEVDLLDVGGPYEILLTANRLAVRAGDEAPFEVVTFSVDGAPVSAYGGLGLTPSHDVASVGDLDVVLVPGTIDLAPRLADEEFLEAVRAVGERSGVAGSVCTGAFFLGATGQLDGRPWTTHFEDVDDLAEMLGADGARRDVRWVDDGDVVTAGGLSSGIDMALHLVARFVGRELAEATAAQIDHVWRATRTTSAG